MNKKTTTVLIVLLALFGGAIAWVSFRTKVSPEFAKISKMAETLIDTENSLTQSERDEGWREVKQRWASLTKTEQKTLMTKIEEREIETHNRFFELKTEEERNAFLDKELDRREAKKNSAGESKKVGRQKTGGKAESAEDKSNGGKKRIDHDAVREKLRDHLDSKTADQRTKERLYWTALKQRWADRNGINK